MLDFFFSISGIPDNWLSVAKSIVNDKDSTFKAIFTVKRYLIYDSV